MMKFGTPRHLTVPSTLPAVEARSPIPIAANSEHDTRSVRFFRSSANFSSRSIAISRRAYLRIAESSRRSAHTIANELAIVACLRSAGLVRRPADHCQVGDLVISQDTVEPRHASQSSRRSGRRQRELDELSSVDMVTSGFHPWISNSTSALKTVPSALNQKVPDWPVASFDAAGERGRTIPDLTRKESCRLQDSAHAYLGMRTPSVAPRRCRADEPGLDDDSIYPRLRRIRSG